MVHGSAWYYVVVGGGLVWWGNLTSQLGVGLSGRAAGSIPRSVLGIKGLALQRTEK